MAGAMTGAPLPEGSELEQYLMTIDGQPEAVVQDTPAAVVVRAPSADRNRIFRLRLPREGLDAAIEELLRPFRAHRVPVSWYLDAASTPLSLADCLPIHGVSFQYAWRVMQRFPAEEAPFRPIPDVAIVPAVSPAERALWTQVVLEAFGLSWFHDLRSCLLTTGRDSGRWHCLMAVSRGVPVGGTLLFTGNGVVGLHWLGVLRSWRKQGIGRNLVTAACAGALHAGCPSITLQCDEQLLPFYHRLGFSEEGRVAVFEWRPGIVNDAAGKGG